MLASYSATLVSFLAVANAGLNFQTLNEMIDLSGYQLGIIKGTSLEELFQVTWTDVF